MGGSESCNHHQAHVEHFERLDARVGDIEDTLGEVQLLVAKIDTLVATLNKMYWIVVTAVAGCLVAAVLALVLK